VKYAFSNFQEFAIERSTHDHMLLCEREDKIM